MIFCCLYLSASDCAESFENLASQSEQRATTVQNPHLANRHLQTAYFYKFICAQTLADAEQDPEKATQYIKQAEIYIKALKDLREQLANVAQHMWEETQKTSL
ncbi:MAG: hypothetical protein H6850_02290 [Alphaproteobacteria bacterium]|nr:MAG: hypothetical protein H6850_02290 [Alphaproteobacteria bacterium]